MISTLILTIFFNSQQRGHDHRKNVSNKSVCNLKSFARKLLVTHCFRWDISPGFSYPGWKDRDWSPPTPPPSYQGYFLYAHAWNTTWGIFGKGKRVTNINNHHFIMVTKSLPEMNILKNGLVAVIPMARRLWAWLEFIQSNSPLYRYGFCFWTPFKRRNKVVQNCRCSYSFAPKLANHVKTKRRW